MGVCVCLRTCVCVCYYTPCYSDRYEQENNQQQATSTFEQIAFRCQRFKAFETSQTPPPKKHARAKNKRAHCMNAHLQRAPSQTKSHKHKKNDNSKQQVAIKHKPHRYFVQLYLNHYNSIASPKISVTSSFTSFTIRPALFADWTS